MPKNNAVTQKLVNTRKATANLRRQSYIDRVSDYVPRSLEQYQGLPIEGEYDIPNITVTPNDDVTNRLKNILPDDLRYDFYKEFSSDDGLSEREQARRFVELYYRAGQPKLETRNIPLNLISGIFNEDNVDRASYDVTENIIYTPKRRIDDYISELAHALQYHDNKLGNYRLTLKDNFKYRRGDDEKYGVSGYFDPNNQEYKAHQILEPAIYHYLRDNRVGNLYNDPKDYYDYVDRQAINEEIMRIPRIKQNDEVYKKYGGRIKYRKRG